MLALSSSSLSLTRSRAAAETPLKHKHKKTAGTDESKPLLLALDGVIYDVSESRNFYGPGGPYAVFAGRECARALCMMKIDEDHCTDDVAGATEAQLKTLADWKKKFETKYKVVGKVVKQ
jgi:membrane-associated progesterone receptor component